MTARLIRRTALATLAVTASTAAMAHIGADGAAHIHAPDWSNSLAQGFTHPLTGLDHLAAMVTVGLWSVLGQKSQTSDRGPWRLLSKPLAFALTLLIGAAAGMTGMSVPGVEPMIAASLLVLGLLLATRAQMAPTVSASLVAAFAFFHGAAHGQELSGHAIAALAGMVLCTGLLHTAGMAAGFALRAQSHNKQRWTERVTGAGVALFGLTLLTPAVAAVL